MSNSDIYFPYYSGNIRLTKVVGLVNLTQFIRAHQNPTEKNRAIFEAIKLCSEDKKKKRELKHKLYSFTPSVHIQVGKKRCYNNVVGFSGLSN